MTLDPKALEAARLLPIGSERHEIITAYLSTLTTGDVGELVDRLRAGAPTIARHARTAKCWPGDNDFEDSARLMREASSLIQSQAARIAALEADRETVEVDKVAVEICDAVMSWMVKRELIDADAEYRDREIIDALDGIFEDPAGGTDDPDAVARALLTGESKG